MVKQKPECRFCKVDTPKHKVTKRFKLQLFEETDKFVDLICVNEIQILHRVGRDKDSKKYKHGSIKHKIFTETCDNHIVLLKEKVI